MPVDGNTSGRMQTSASVTVDFSHCLKEKCIAIEVAARETEHETEPCPRNLLAAAMRIERHIEIFLKLTNPELVALSLPPTTLSYVTICRRHCASVLVEVGEILGCPDGFLTPAALNYSDMECRSRLLQAASMMKILSGEFRALLTSLTDVGHVTLEAD
jgi:hypothetical protein